MARHVARERGRLYRGHPRDPEPPRADRDPRQRREHRVRVRRDDLRPPHRDVAALPRAHLQASFFLTRAGDQHGERGWGRIVMVSSTRADRVAPRRRLHHRQARGDRPDAGGGTARRPVRDHLRTRRAPAGCTWRWPTVRRRARPPTAASSRRRSGASATRCSHAVSRSHRRRWLRRSRSSAATRRPASSGQAVSVNAGSVVLPTGAVTAQHALVSDASRHTVDVEALEDRLRDSPVRTERVSQPGERDHS